ncbi:MAG: hypothetical protein ABIK65_08145 [Candidatus Eisenbacteria bacterium]
MSLYAAETHARTSREEVLLSRLFGTLDLLDRDAYLGGLLREASVDIASGDLPSAQIQFWPELGTCRPDVVIESDSLLLFVVGRGRNEIDADALLLLAERGWKFSPRFNLLVITDGNDSPPELETMATRFPQKKEPPLRWISWSSVYRVLHRRLRETGAGPPTREVLQDLLGLLAAEGLAPFVGFDPSVLRAYRESLPAFDRLHGSARLFVSDLEARLQAAGIRRISMRGEGDGDLSAQAPREVDLDFVDESWNPGIVSVGGLFVHVDYMLGEVRAGFRANLADSSAKALLVEGRSRIAEVFRENEEVFIRMTGEEASPVPGRDPSLLARLETRNGAGRLERVELLSTFDGSEVDVTERVVGALVAFRDIAVNVPLLPIHRIDGESPFVVAGQ